MKEVDKGSRCVFTTLSNIWCNGNVFSEIVYDQKSLTIFTKKSIIDNWQGPKYTSGTLNFSIFSSYISSSVLLHKCLWNK